jgi:hypothetical protein
VHLVYREFITNSNIVVSFHHTIAMKCCLEDDKIERQLKCKMYDMELCILRCFKEYHTKAQFSFMMVRVCETYIYIKKIIKSMVCMLNFTIFKIIT